MLFRSAPCRKFATKPSPKRAINIDRSVCRLCKNHQKSSSLFVMIIDRKVFVYSEFYQTVDNGILE